MLHHRDLSVLSRVQVSVSVEEIFSSFYPTKRKEQHKKYLNIIQQQAEREQRRMENIELRRKITQTSGVRVENSIHPAEKKAKYFLEVQRNGKIKDGKRAWRDL